MRSLTTKLTLAFLLTGLASVALVGIFARYLTRVEFDRFLRERELLDFSAAVTNYYQQHGAWAGIDEELRVHPPHGLDLPPPPPPDGRPPRWLPPWLGGPPPDQQGPPPNRQGPPPFLLIDARGLALTRSPLYRIGEPVPPDVITGGTPVTVKGVRVGTAVMLSLAARLDPRESDYLARTNQTLIYATLGGTALALLMGIVLTRVLIRPILALTHAIRAMRAGEMRQEVPVSTQDELGELVRAFNQLSADLAQAHQARRQMTADIAHELRTPLSVLTGYIESMRDGVLPPSRARFQTMFEEATQLQRLIDELRLLSLAEAGELPLKRQPTAPDQLLADVAASFAPQAARQQVALAVRASSNLPAVVIDRERVLQVFGNLVSNALRYTPPGGSIVLAVESGADKLRFTVADSGSGIAPEHLPHIFERLYRADAARETDDGGTGLGLAIAKAIVEAHGGWIGASSRLGQGTTITITI